MKGNSIFNVIVTLFGKFNPSSKRINPFICPFIETTKHLPFIQIGLSALATIKFASLVIVGIHRVIPQSIQMAVHSFAEIALVRFNLCMNNLMSHKIPISCKLFVTNVTAQEVLSGMESHVVCQRTLV